MKAQKLGLVLGINMVAACLIIQGCAAPNSEKYKKRGGSAPTTMGPETSGYPSSSANKPVITVKSTAPRTEPVVASVEEPPVAPPPSAEPAPSAVSTVKQLPPTPSKAPKAKPAAAPAPAAAPTVEYVVKPGDTLFLISKRTNYRQAAILAANPGLDANRIRVGQKIKLPGAVSAPATAVAKAAAPEAKSAAKDGKVLPAAAPAPAAANTKAPVKTKSSFVAYEGPTKDYTVKSGDSLGKIAMEYGISIRALKALNGLQKDNLRLGQKLKVPTEKQTAAKTAAKPAAAKPAAAKADAAKAPAKADDAAKDAPAKADDAAKEEPAVKDAAAPAPAAVEKPADAENPADAAKTDGAAAKPGEAAGPEATVPASTYTVKEGDDLVSIAIAYGISPSALMDINDLKPTDEIKPGQVLKLPANAKASAQ